MVANDGARREEDEAVSEPPPRSDDYPERCPGEDSGALVEPAALLSRFTWVCPPQTAD